MNEFFLKIINMNISASWLVLALLILRLVLRKAPKWVNVLLWGIVAIRLVCPFSLESPVSLVPNSIGTGELVSVWMDDYIGDIDIHHPDSVYYDAAIGAGREPISDGEGGYYIVTKHDQLGEPSTIENTVMPVLAIAWSIGMVLLALYTTISYWCLHRRVATAVRYRDNIFQSDNVPSPFVLGIIKPRIYLPFRLDGQVLEHVVAHEQAHIHRRDHWWKPLGFLLLTIHWFNPLMWLAYVLLCRDIELACDEKVIKELGSDQRADYTQALVSCSVSRRTIAVCPLAFGEVGVKERVKSVMNYRKPAFWVVAVAVIACVVVAICFLTNPKEDVPKEEVSKEEMPDGIELADLDGDGVSEQLVTEELTPNEHYAVQIIREDGSVLWSAELGLPHTGWDAYFLYQDNDVNGILRYNPVMFQGFASYFYELYTFPNGEQTTYMSEKVEFNTNPDSEDPWPAEAAAFAEEVNALLSHSKLLISTLDGELHQYGDTDVVWSCESPLSRDNTQEVSFVELMGMDCWYAEEETTPGLIERTYYAAVADSDMSFRLAESFGLEIDDHIVDLDGDGVTELVSNCQWGDGAKRIYIYRMKGNTIERGWLNWDASELNDFNDWSVNATQESYDPETGFFMLDYDTNRGAFSSRAYHYLDFKFEEYAQVPNAEQLQTPNTTDNLFASMPGTFHFLSGAGGWQTELYWNGDGTFSGIFEDADVSEIYRCFFTGSMDAPQRIGDLEFSAHVTALNYDKSNTVTYENGQKVISASPYGLDDVDEIRIYLPGYPVSELPDEALSWLYGGAEEFSAGEPEKLPFFVLYNVRGQQAFFSASWSAFSGASSYRPEHTNLTFVVEGLEESIPVYLFRDLEYSLYIPQDDWQYQRILEDDMLAKCWTSAINPEVSLTVRHLGYRSLEEAQEWEREQNTGFQLIEDKQGGIGGTDSEGKSMLEIFFYSGQSTVYAVELRYPVESTEGFGTRLHVMLDTFQCQASDYGQ